MYRCPSTMTFIQILVITFISWISTVHGAGSHWGYEGKIGPKNWHRLFPKACSGRSQSPVNIVKEKTVYNPDLIDFAIWYDPPKPGSSFFIQNNGHTIQVSTNGPFFVTNGGLPAKYTTAQFHFHWGQANHQGSEHLIDGIASPLELHVVNYDAEKYTVISKAMKQAEGLAVLGVLFRVVDEDNLALEEIIRNFPQIRDPDVSVEVNVRAQAIRHFLPKDTSRYFRYNGSLTTPGCFESVVWTVFEERQTISQRQLDAFRDILQPKRKTDHMRRRRRNIERQEEKAAREVLDEVGIRNNPLEKLQLQLEMEKDQKALAQEEKATIIQEYKLSTRLANDSPDPVIEVENQGNGVKTDISMAPGNETKKDKGYQIGSNSGHSEDSLDEIPEVFIQEMLWDNFRPVQPLNDRVVYRSFPLQEIRIVKSYSSYNRNSAPTIIPSFLILVASFFVKFLCL